MAIDKVNYGDLKNLLFFSKNKDTFDYKTYNSKGLDENSINSIVRTLESKIMSTLSQGLDVNGILNLLKSLSKQYNIEIDVLKLYVDAKDTNHIFVDTNIVDFWFGFDKVAFTLDVDKF